MVLIREETPEDYAAISRVVEAAFGRPAEARLVEALRRDSGFDPRLSLVADDGRLAGHVLFTPIRIDGAGRSHHALALAPMAVLPGLQRHGVGSMLVREGLKRCGELGHSRVIVLGHEEYYPRFGFTPASRFGIRAPFDVPGAAFMAIGLTAHALDNATGMVVYPPAFMNV